jgi:hypothetical protein
VKAQPVAQTQAPAADEDVAEDEEEEEEEDQPGMKAY